MLKNYFKIAIRNLSRHKGYAMINIVGLAVGIAACMIILRYVQFERSFDQFQEHADRIYRVEAVVNEDQRRSSTRVDLATILREQFADVEETSRIIHSKAILFVDDKRFLESRFAYVEPSFFKFFDVSLIEGAPADLGRPNTMMLSVSQAKKYFGRRNPVGRIIEMPDGPDFSMEPYEVVGVFEDMPANSHLALDFLTSMASTDLVANERQATLCQTYLLLGEATDGNAFNEKLRMLDAGDLGWANSPETLYSVALKQIYLFSETIPEAESEARGDIGRVYLFSLIALLIIVLACVNYTNLATARAASRSREVGVRKIVGASHRQLMVQFLSESFVFVLIALALATVLAELALPFFNYLLGQHFWFDWTNLDFIGIMALGLILVAILAGLYPAFLLSRYQPAQVLKGTLNASTLPQLRKGLVIFQFAVSIGFIVATFVIHQQLHYMTEEQQLGFEQEQRLVLSTAGLLGEDGAAFKQALEGLADVEQVALGSGLPGHAASIASFSKQGFEGAEGDEDVWLYFDFLEVDEDYLETLGINVVAGRPLTNVYATDSVSAVVLNETAVRVIGWDDPVGKTIRQNGEVQTVVGIVEDFHLTNFKESVRPMMLVLGPSTAYATLHLVSDNFKQSLLHIEALWEAHIPLLPIQYAFLDDTVETMYREETRLGWLFALFSSMAVLIACLGLFGLAAYTSIQRTKEIGIRKILGAGTSLLIRMLSTEYLKLVGYAFLLITPLVFFLMDNWLQSFVYRIELSAWIFIGAGFVAFLIAMLTVAYQSIRTSTANPVEALRYE